MCIHIRFEKSLKKKMRFYRRGTGFLPSSVAGNNCNKYLQNNMMVSSCSFFLIILIIFSLQNLLKAWKYLKLTHLIHNTIWERIKNPTNIQSKPFPFSTLRNFKNRTKFPSRCIPTGIDIWKQSLEMWLSLDSMTNF